MEQPPIYSIDHLKERPSNGQPGKGTQYSFTDAAVTVSGCVSTLGCQPPVTRVAKIFAFIPTVLLVFLLLSLSFSVSPTSLARHPRREGGREWRERERPRGRQHRFFAICAAYHGHITPPFQTVISIPSGEVYRLRLATWWRLLD